MKNNQQEKAITMLMEMLASGVNNLHNNYPYIDKLNVFPVPDGDTGTNMNLTATNGFNEIKDSEFQSVSEILSSFSRGLVMGARGNSGVIFSQIIKGFSKGIEGRTDHLTVADWKKAFEEGVKIAYKAVMKPVEGTILTVIRETSEKLSKLPDSTTIKNFWAKVVEYSNESLENTPNLLKALKDVGVVDSGGYGLVKFLEGMAQLVIKGQPVLYKTKLEANTGNNIEMDIRDREFGYCTEVVVLLNNKWISDLKISKIQSQLQIYGNTSSVVIIDEDILKVHTHALNPGQVLTFLQQYGDFKNVKVENMNLQSKYQVKQTDEALIEFSSKDPQWVETSTITPPRLLRNEMMTISVVSSNSLKNYFEKELGVDFAIDAGSNMNPSTKDFLNAIAIVDAKHVFISPNNSNVLLTAKQSEREEKKSRIHVIPTKSIQQGMVAALNFDPTASPSRNNLNLNKVIKNVVSINISKAVRDTLIDNVTIKENDFMAIVDGKIEFSNPNLATIFSKVFVKYINYRAEIVTIFVGQDTESKDVSYLRKLLDEEFNVEYEIIESDQKVYNYLISIE